MTTFKFLDANRKIIEITEPPHRSVCKYCNLKMLDAHSCWQKESYDICMKLKERILYD